MNTPSENMTTNPIDLTLELRFANGSVTKIQESDAERIRATLTLLAAPRLFGQGHLLLASQHSASMIPYKGIDMILARTSAPLPLKFPLSHPAGLFDLVEQRDARPDNELAAAEDQEGPPCHSNSRVEIQTLGAWAVTLEAVTLFHGNAQDERQFFSQLPNMPTIPFRLAEGGFGLINTANILRVSAWPKPETLPDTALPLELCR